MEATMLAQLINQILSQLPLMGPLLLLVWFLKIGNDKMIGALDLERKDRLDGMKNQINVLEKRSDKCDEDRIVLHRENATLRERMEEFESIRASRQKAKAL
jgi:hypothetical protein